MVVIELKLEKLDMFIDLCTTTRHVLEAKIARRLNENDNGGRERSDRFIMKVIVDS
jgi:hypothetical protein